MEKSFRSFWLFFAILATLFETGLCIRCYQCTSRRDPRCGDPFSGDLRPTECTRESVTNTLSEITYAVRGSPGIAEVFSGSTYSCLKINSISNSQYQNLTIVRGCYFEKMDGRDICTNVRSKVIDQSTLPFCETCTGEACNGSNKITSANLLALLFSPLLAIFVTRQ